MLVPRNLNDSTAATVLSMMVSGEVSGEESGGGAFPPEVHYHLHSFDAQTSGA